MELGRNFANKVWNACRFLQMKRSEIPPGTHASESWTPSTADRWIASRYHTTVTAATVALEEFRITEYAKILYDFIWRDFCDWYVEIVKVQFAEAESDAHRSALMEHAYRIIEGTLTLLHPVMPFLTEELWHGLFDAPASRSISVTAAPVANPETIDAPIEARFELLQNIVEAIRRQRAEMGIPPGERLDVHLSAPSDLVSFFTEQAAVITSLARVANLVVGSGLAKPDGSVADVVRGTEVFLVVAGKVDLEKERTRLTKERERLLSAISGVEKKLSNEAFVANAKPEVVESERRKLADWTDAVAKIERNLGSL